MYRTRHPAKYDGFTTQPAVRELARLGHLPSSRVIGELEFDRIEKLVLAITAPVSDEDARALIRLLDDNLGERDADDCFGLKWTLVQLIESAPSRQYLSTPGLRPGFWVMTLADRIAAQLSRIAPFAAYRAQAG